MLLEDWNWDPYRIAFGMEILRAAARKRGQPVGALIVGGSVTRRFIADLGNGSRAFLSYLYGPLRVIGPPWADHEPTVREWSELLGKVGRFEEDILAAHRRPAGAAILVANTSEINTAYINTAFHRYPLLERAAMYIALMDAKVPVEAVGEEEVLEDDILKNYRVLYVSDPHVSAGAQDLIREWVHGGGVLWANYAALARDEYDQPSDRFNEVFGIADRPPLEPAPTTWQEADAEHIVVREGELLPAMDLRVVPLKPRYTLSTGQALADFPDGTPAIVHNRFGNGQAFLVGSTAYPLVGAHGPRVDEPPDAALKRQVVTLGARAAGVTPHVRSEHPRTLWFVHDAPDHSVVYVTSCFNGDIPAAPAEIWLPRRPSVVTSGSTDSLPFEWLGDRARIHLALPRNAGEIIVFRYAESAE